MKRIVGFSGGIDSQACALWVRRRFPADEIILLNSTAGEEVNPLYKLGMNRVGCNTCVKSGKDEIREWAARFPAEVERVRLMESRTGLPYFRFKVLGKDAFVDDVVKWSRTDRGGKQMALPTVEADAEAGRCASLYGLCE